MEGIPSGGAFAPTYVTKKSDSVTSGTYFESGDILVAKITPSFENGKQALTRDLGEPFGYATTEVIPIRPKAAGHDPRVLFYYLLHPDIRSFVAERMEGSTGRQRVPEGVLLELPLPCFTDSEQTAIGDALDHVQRALQLEDALSNASLSLKRAAMRALFTRGLRGEAQQETEFGVAPENWSSVLLSECATVQTGVTKGRNLSGDETIDIPYLRVANVQDGHLDLSEMKSIPIRTSEIDRYRLLPGDVVLTEGGDFDKLGRGFIWRGEIELCTHQNHVFAVRLRSDPLQAFAGQSVRSRLSIF